MATRIIQYRGATIELDSNKKAVEKPRTASYRGSTYTPDTIVPAPKVKHGMYRGAPWSK